MNFYIYFNISNQNPTFPPYFFSFLFTLSFCLYLLSQFLMTHAIFITLHYHSENSEKSVKNRCKWDVIEEHLGFIAAICVILKREGGKENTCLMYGKDNTRQSGEQYLKTIYSFWTWSVQISMFNENFTTYNIVPAMTLLKIERWDLFMKVFCSIDIIIYSEKIICLVLCWRK